VVTSRRIGQFRGQGPSGNRIRNEQGAIEIVQQAVRLSGVTLPHEILRPGSAVENHEIAYPLPSFPGVPGRMYPEKQNQMPVAGNGNFILSDLHELPFPPQVFEINGEPPGVGVNGAMQLDYRPLS
jgi:hypothetical protein